LTSTESLAVSAGVALAPAIGFLAGLLFVDSYKLIRPAFVLWMLVAGAVAAGVALVVNSALVNATDMAMVTYSRGIAPAVEEALKAALIVVLIRRERVGFMVDAAILGFAIGSGFAIVENLQYLRLVPHATLSTWLVRGFGTALMHGGATALFGVMAISIIERRPTAGWFAFVPGYALAVALHAGYNFLSNDPLQATLGALIGVPALLLTTFHFSEQALRRWIGTGFDHDAQMLELLDAGTFSKSPMGVYLETLKRRLKPIVLFDVFCYLRLSCELSLRVKGLLMLRENELPVPPLDEATKANIDELRHLEKSIGRVGMRALQPLISARRKFLWQLGLLEATAEESPG
jgi:RsiW-degrading membrane proteinase PrsW (M82 family)